MESPPHRTGISIQPDLIARVAKGDRQAFSEVYDRSSPLLFSLALRILGNRDDAAYLLQEVYLEVWRKSVRYDIRRGTPMAWLTILTRSRAIDRLRSRAARMDAHSSPVTETTVRIEQDSELSPLDRRLHEELQAVVMKALAELPLPQQQALELAYYEGLSHSEIAKRLNEPLGTIKTRIRLGLNKLKNGLGAIAS